MPNHRTRPWGVHEITDMYPFYVETTDKNGRPVRAVAMAYSCNMFERVRSAWWVLTGRAEAVIWPEPGDLEKIFPAFWDDGGFEEVEPHHGMRSVELVESTIDRDKGRTARSILGKTNADQS